MSEPVQQLDEDKKVRQRKRSLAIALILGLLVVLFYVTTIFRLGGNVVRPF